jgi:hypothetical protein
MYTSSRKRKTRHIKLRTVGGSAKLQFGSKTVTITVNIPRQHLIKRLK